VTREQFGAQCVSYPTVIGLAQSGPLLFGDCMEEIKALSRPRYNLLGFARSAVGVKVT
jgi:hypothetical protein